MLYRCQSETVCTKRQIPVPQVLPLPIESMRLVLQVAHRARGAAQCVRHAAVAAVAAAAMPTATAVHSAAAAEVRLQVRLAVRVVHGAQPDAVLRGLLHALREPLFDQ